MLKKFFYPIVVLIVLINVVIILTAGKNEIPSSISRFIDKKPNHKDELTYKVQSIKIPPEISFAGERVPFKDYDVRDRLTRELLVNTYWHSNTIFNFMAANRWFPTIEPILKEQGVPDDFKYLALIESGLQNVVSPSNAAGVWQFLPETGKRYGLIVNDEIDERYHLEKATVAACKYLKEAYATFGNSWTMAAASYNVGINGLQRSIDKQSVNNYYDLYLNTETSRYVFRIIAMKEIHLNQKKYGFSIDEEDLFKPIKIKMMSVDTTINDLYAFSIQQNVSYKRLKMLNPWLRKTNLPNKEKKIYLIKLPHSE